jgi:hypothetical protein
MAPRLMPGSYRQQGPSEHAWWSRTLSLTGSLLSPRQRLGPPQGLRFLESLARHDRPPRRQLKPGTVLVREYEGRRHTVATVRDGFDLQGTVYRSLSAIARAITGAAWSGPRFFARSHKKPWGRGDRAEGSCGPPHMRGRNQPQGAG